MAKKQVKEKGKGKANEKDKSKGKANEREKGNDKGKGKKGKKGKDELLSDSEVQNEMVAIPEPKPEPVEVQFTDTSYTSASFESVPSVIIQEDTKKKPKKKRKLGTEVSEVVPVKSEEFQWSEDSLPLGEEPKKLVEEEEKSKKKKKGKKGKKAKEELPVFEKPKKWGKMNKKDREAWMQQRIEEFYAEKEAEKQAILAGAKEKRARLARERAEQMAKDNEEQEVRRDLLAKTVALFHKYELQKVNHGNKKQAEEEWQQYIRCDGLPDPRVLTQMTTYLHKWKESNVFSDDELERRCIECLPMLEKLEEIVADSRHYTERQAKNYNDIRSEVRRQLALAIEMASYMLLRDIERCLKLESIKLATYQREFNGLRLNLWVAIKMPTRKPKPVEPELEPVELTFPAMRVGVKLPTIVDASSVAVRAARSMVDLLSESSRTFALPADMPDRYEDLFAFNVKEHMDVTKLKEEQDDVRNNFYKDLAVKVKELETFLKANPYTKNEKEKEDLDNLNMSEPPFMPEPRQFIAEQNELNFEKYLKKCIVRTRAGEVNLRKYRISGGVLNLDLLTIPPQAKRMRGAIYVTTLCLPKALKPMKYQVQYRAPSPPPAGVTRTPEEIEAEMKRIETEYEKLALVFIELPQDIMWQEPPVVCQWQEKRKLWTTNYVNDYKFNEDKLTIQFRSGVLWPIGIATLRYGNIPYQGWDMRPDPEGKGVILSVTGVNVTVTWICLGSTVRLKWIANAPTSALKEHFNKPYSVKKMIQIMQEAACDFFPDFDAHNHIEGTCRKEWVAERHNYHAMAFLSRSYNFQWSRWNAAAGYRNIVMQIREAVDKKREAKFQLLYLSPERSYILKCNEMVQEFETEPAVGMAFYPDLFTLNMAYGSVDARRYAFNIKFRLAETVFELLQELKLSSYS